MMNYESFPLRIRSDAEVARIQQCYQIGQDMVQVLNPDEPLMRKCITHWEAMGTDNDIALALAFRNALEARSAGIKKEESNDKS